MIQWLAGIATAVWLSPRTWTGTSSELHVHIWAAVFLGAIIISLPVLLIRRLPGHTLTRQVIAVAQMLSSGLLIHLTGGRIETHFHIFGSLAFLASYRDWRALATATVVVSIDHMVRGIFWPQSVFGIATSDSWRWLEHAGWVLFEDAFLVIFIRQSLDDMYDVALQRAELESHNADVERQVVERTADLRMANKQLLEATRQAGMAEVATNVLHNVGNVLNSVNVSAELVAGRVRQWRTENLAKVAGMLRDHADDLPSFLSLDPRGRELPGYLLKLSEGLAAPQGAILQEISTLKGNIEHIKEVVSRQQDYGKKSSVVEKVNPVELVEDAIRINNAALIRHHVDLVREYEEVPSILTDRHHVLQILVNLLSNAKHALSECPGDKRIILRLGLSESDALKIEIEDNGAGIAPENLTRIFQHGFTTRRDGHGFGLHSGALSAKSLGGKLSAHSLGAGMGASFVLELPLQMPN